MDCRETREKLSAFADSETDGEERERVRGHLAGCPACRRELQDQGALDMLLKSCFVKEPPEVTIEGIWPSVSDRIDGEDGKAGNGGGTVRDGGEIVFKSSSAMQMLHIPEAAPAPVAAAQGPGAPPAPRSGWVWPVALVFSSAILAGGFVLYKRMTPASSDAARETAPAVAAASAGSPDSGMKVAAAETASGAASQPSQAVSEEPTELASAKGGVKGKRAATKGVKVAAAAGAKAEEKTESAEPAKAEPPKPARKGGDDLDSLIDDAIGPGQAAGPKKKKEPAAAAPNPAEDVPEQLTMNQIRGAMNKVKGHVQACYDKYQIEGEARVSFSINPDGSVGDCSIKGKFFGTDTGTCVVSAVKKAHFPKFSGRPMTISSYPFLLQ